jgi:hypothetical protein
MDLDNLKIKITQYKNSREMLWDKETMTYFREWIKNEIGYTFGVSPQCWNQALNIAIKHLNL